MLLARIERYWAFPGKRTCEDLQRLCETRLDEFRALAGADRARSCGCSSATPTASRPDPARQRERPTDDAVRRRGPLEHRAGARASGPTSRCWSSTRSTTGEEAGPARAPAREMRGDDDEFIYDVVVVPSFEDAIIAVLFNHNIQSCVLRYQFPVESRQDRGAAPLPRHGHPKRLKSSAPITTPAARCPRRSRALRPELDLFKVTDETARQRRGQQHALLPARVLPPGGLPRAAPEHPQGHPRALRDALLRRAARVQPQADRRLPRAADLARQVDHQLATGSRTWGGSTANIFLAETSSTTGGLDSLLQPTGPDQARPRKKAARAFGARQSFFVTNGTSTANKIVTQALVRPGDLVLLSHDCHKSHPYALVLAGAFPVYLDAYPLNEFTMFGGVPLREIKRQLFRLKQAGSSIACACCCSRTARSTASSTTPSGSCARCWRSSPTWSSCGTRPGSRSREATPTYRRRTAMAAAARLREFAPTRAYRERYAAWAEETAPRPGRRGDLGRPRAPARPGAARMRVYATQSTHKTLTSLRQGSMIHVYDQDFEQKAGTRRSTRPT